MEDPRYRIARLEAALKDKDRYIEQLLMDRDQELMDLRQSMKGFHVKCDNCERMRLRWKKISKNFQEGPKLLETMISRTDKLFEDAENQ